MSGRLAAILFILFLQVSFGQITLHSFKSNGEFIGGLYWLNDPRLTQSAEWVFTGVPSPADLTVDVEVYAYGPCGAIDDSDLYLRFFYGAPGSHPWASLDVTLDFAGEDPATGIRTYRGRRSFGWRNGGTLIFQVRRMLPCGAYIGVKAGSLRLSAGKAVVLRPTPRPSIPAVERRPEAPLSSAPGCPRVEGPECWRNDGSRIRTLCGLDVRVPRVERVRLPETFGPKDAPALGAGHYVGELGETVGPYALPDNQDWYKVTLRGNQAAVIYLQAPPGLKYRLYIKDLCGYVQSESAGTGDVFCVIPCEKGACTFYIHIFREAGAGEYLLSVYILEPAG